ncbi:anti-repressor SinI family protein [Ammoniphilus sp. YIM 78166]|nr:anti-repressor SinI family protein [Ammoniphilus sp. YIM 78166]
MSTQHEEGTWLDPEWIELINEAVSLGLSIEEIRDFLNQHQKLVSA